MPISDGRDQQLGRLMQQLSDEFGRQKEQSESAQEAAKRMGPRIDGLALMRQSDRGLSTVLTTARAEYRRLAQAWD